MILFYIIFKSYLWGVFIVKLNQECMLEILEYIEANTPVVAGEKAAQYKYYFVTKKLFSGDIFVVESIKNKDYSQEEIAYALLKLVETGMIEAIQYNETNANTFTWNIGDITMKGHYFLESKKLF